MPPVTIDDLKYRARLSQRLAAIMLAVVVISTIIRPLIASMSPWLTTAGICNAVVLLGIYYLIGSGRVLEKAPLIVCHGASLMLLVLYCLTGGASGQFAPIVPVLPMIAMMLGGATLCIATTAVWALVTLIDLALPSLFAGGLNAQESIALSRSRSLWLLLSVGTASVFAFYLDRSMTQLKTKLQRQATIDPLTGLLNRRGLRESVGWEIARAARTEEPIAVLLADIDHFKELNDRYGHEAGDQALQVIARALKSSVRAGQDLVSRYGGEEFAIVLTNSDYSAALIAAEKVRKAVANLPPIASAPGSFFSITIGVSLLEQPLARQSTIEARLSRFEELMREADDALYRGKAGGRDQVVIAS